MRHQLLLIPLALLTSLALASPAAAVDWKVDAIDYEFQPAEPQIAVGDSVTWNFSDEGHTSASESGQAESWSSVSEGTNAAGTTYTKVFNTPGRYQYVCTPHQTFMKGVIQVGTDTVANSVGKFTSKRTGNRVKLSVRLKEPATVTYRLKGPSPRTVKRGRLRAGLHSFTVRRLKRGSYRGVMTVTDDFDTKLTPRNSFVIR
jgi:plastocyanin